MRLQLQVNYAWITNTYRGTDRDLQLTKFRLLLLRTRICSSDNFGTSLNKLTPASILSTLLPNHSPKSTILYHSQIQNSHHLIMASIHPNDNDHASSPTSWTTAFEKEDEKCVSSRPSSEDETLLHSHYHDRTTHSRRMHAVHISVWYSVIAFLSLFVIYKNSSDGCKGCKNPALELWCK